MSAAHDRAPKLITTISPLFPPPLSPIPLPLRTHSLRRDRPVRSPTTSLHILAIHARRTPLHHSSRAGLRAPLEVDVFEVEGVDVPGEVSGKERSTRDQYGMGMGKGTGVEMAGRRRRGGCGLGWAYPRIVRQMLMRRSAPQPAIMNTPSGGTGGQKHVSNVHLQSGLSEEGRGWGSVRKMVMMMIKSAETGLVPAIVILGN